MQGTRLAASGTLGDATCPGSRQHSSQDCGVLAGKCAKTRAKISASVANPTFNAKQSGVEWHLRMSAIDGCTMSMKAFWIISPPGWMPKHTDSTEIDESLEASLVQFVLQDLVEH